MPAGHAVIARADPQQSSGSALFAFTLWHALGTFCPQQAKIAADFPPAEGIIDGI